MSVVSSDEKNELLLHDFDDFLKLRKDIDYIKE